MLYIEGNLCTEDREIRRIARLKMNDSVRSFESKLTLLVDSLISKLNRETEAAFTCDSLLEFLFSHPKLQQETSTIVRYAHAFPELKDVVSQKQERITAQARTRIENALFPFKQARRFRFTKGFHIS